VKVLCICAKVTEICQYNEYHLQTWVVTYLQIYLGLWLCFFEESVCKSFRVVVEDVTIKIPEPNGVELNGGHFSLVDPQVPICVEYAVSEEILVDGS
jgi:hypothetical protein